MTLKEGVSLPDANIIYGVEYNFTPKVVLENGSVPDAGVILKKVCLLGEDCEVSELLFKDYTGNDVASIESVVTLNGVVVDHIDTSVLATYVVTTVAVDNFGNRSEDYIREYIYAFHPILPT